MATTRIADLPSATNINDTIYLPLDSYTTEGTVKASLGEIKNAMLAPSSLNLGTVVCAAILTSAAGTLEFTIPTGRIFPAGTQITSLSFNIVARASSSDGGGKYIIHKVGEPYGAATFTLGSNFTFANASDQTQTITPTQATVSLQGGTNIYIWFSTGTGNFFTGSSTITGYTNNNAVTLRVSDITLGTSSS